MRRSGTDFRGRFTIAGACLVCLCGSACGDSVVVAREFSLVSAAVESRDAGSDADEQSDGPHFNFGHGGTGPFGPRTPSGAGGSSSKGPHDKSGTGGSGGGSSTKSGTPKHP